MQTILLLVHGFQGDDKYICGGKETVVHVLVDYPKLRDLGDNYGRRLGVSSIIYHLARRGR